MLSFLESSGSCNRCVPRGEDAGPKSCPEVTWTRSRHPRSSGCTRALEVDGHAGRANLRGKRPGQNLGESANNAGLLLPNPPCSEVGPWA